MNFKVKLVIGVLSILAVLAVYAVYENELDKIPTSYEIISEQDGQDRVLESLDGNLSQPFWIRDILRESAVNVNGNILQVNSTVTGIDSATNKVVFENTHTFFVDRTTRKHQSINDYYTFPPNVQKTDYEFFHPLIFAKTPFVFEKEDVVDGLKVYDFSCKYTAVDISSAFPQFPSKKIFSNGACAVSVEPETGMIVSFSKQWDDYFVNGDGSRGAQVELGGKRTTDYSKEILVNNAKSAKSLYYLLDLVFPILVVAVGIIILSVVFLFDKTRNQAKVITQTQSDLVKKEKLSAIGELTARISHDLRNPVGVIKLTIQSIELRLSNNLDPKLGEYLPILNDAVLRINHQINQVLRFVKTIPLDTKLVSFGKVLDDAIKGTVIPKNVTIMTPDEDYTLMVDKIQLSAAFGNILSNAVDAIGEGEGRITIRAKNEKNTLILEFEDSGDGISKENINKIFDPLFTTKQYGTGLGLSSVRAIIEAHKGTISVKSPPTVFTITLPLDPKAGK